MKSIIVLALAFALFVSTVSTAQANGVRAGQATVGSYNYNRVPVNFNAVGYCGAQTAFYSTYQTYYPRVSVVALLAPVLTVAAPAVYAQPVQVFAQPAPVYAPPCPPVVSAPAPVYSPPVAAAAPVYEQAPVCAPVLSAPVYAPGYAASFYTPGYNTTVVRPFNFRHHHHPRPAPTAAIRR